MPKRILQGTVTSDKNEQTIHRPGRAPLQAPAAAEDGAEVEEVRAHDPENKFKVGDVVRIEECAPISKTKRWHVVTEATA